MLQLNRTKWVEFQLYFSKENKLTTINQAGKKRVGTGMCIGTKLKITRKRDIMDIYYYFSVSKTSSLCLFMFMLVQA